MGLNRAVRALLVLIAVTAVWGVTFVQVKDAVALYPLFAFLALRFAIASLTLAAPAARRLHARGRGWTAAAFAGALLGAGYALQTAGLGARRSPRPASSRDVCRLTPLLRLRLPCASTPRRGSASRSQRSGLRFSPGSTVGPARRPVVLRRGRHSLQIVLMERYAPLLTRSRSRSSRCSPRSPACLIALALGQVEVPHGRTVGRASSDGRLCECLRTRPDLGAAVHERTQTALAFSLEPVWAAFFGFTLAGDRLGVVGWLGCGVIMSGIVIAEPSAAGALARLVRRTGAGPTEPLEEP